MSESRPSDSAAREQVRAVVVELLTEALEMAKHGDIEAALERTAIAYEDWHARP